MFSLMDLLQLIPHPGTEGGGAYPSMHWADAGKHPREDCSGLAQDTLFEIQIGFEHFFAFSIDYWAVNKWWFIDSHTI